MAHLFEEKDYIKVGIYACSPQGEDYEAEFDFIKIENVNNNKLYSYHTWGNGFFKDACIIMHKEAKKERLTEKINWMAKVIIRGEDSV
jgi:hypothetical protein